MMREYPICAWEHGPQINIILKIKKDTGCGLIFYSYKYILIIRMQHNSYTAAIELRIRMMLFLYFVGGIGAGLLVALLSVWLYVRLSQLRAAQSCQMEILETLREQNLLLASLRYGIEGTHN